LALTDKGSAVRSPAQASGASSVREPARGLAVSIGQHSDKGRKATNQDFHGALIPDGPTLAQKGVAVALADGISTSPVGHVAAQSAIKSFLTDYYCTSDAWSVKTSAQRVISAANSWLHAETKRSQNAYDRDKGYICTLSALVLKARRAHLFHVGDARIYRLAGETLERLTEDHRVVLSSQETYLGRALGMAPNVEIDYQALDLSEGDVFVLATDGVYEYAKPAWIARTIRESADDLDQAARRIVAEAFARGSPDNLTVQIVRIDRLPEWDADAFMGQAGALPAPPLLEARMVLDGYEILRPLHHSARSHLYIASDAGQRVALKIPSLDRREDAAFLQRFMMEEWIARRIDSPYVVKAHPQDRRRTHLYTVMEFVDGRTLAQWMIDNPEPDLETVRRIVEQIAAGLRAFHRREMAHQDLRPENVMIDAHGTVKLVDFGSARVAGVQEARPALADDGVPGALQYTAPEAFLGEPGAPRADLFALGVIAYQMLTGRLPYGTAAAQATTRARQRKLRYRPAAEPDGGVPDWIDGALRKAVHPDPTQRYQQMSEFLYDLRHPNPTFAGRRVPLYARNPLLFWQGLSFLLAATVIVLLAMRGA
jgi:serine/threonine protein phosphatase PrpC/predicted Ser/Thr protein kinase